jgi:hypothetical protein
MTDYKITPSPYGTWEYVPSGGCVLTAEENYLAGKVLGRLCQQNGHSGEILDLPDALAFLESALFPATEPAEKRRVHNHGPTEGRGLECPQMTVDGKLVGYCIAPELWTAPAVPAEEEAKAEEFDLNALVRQLAQAGWRERELGESFAGGSCIDWDAKSEAAQQIEYQVVRGILTELKRIGLLTLPTSSPVVPAPTETGPWQTWQEVPDGVVYRGTTQSGSPTLSSWVNDNGFRIVHKRGPAPEFGRWNDHEITAFAPFVAVEEAPDAR